MASLFRTVVVCAAVVLVSAHAAPPQLRELHSWTTVDYDWVGSPWGSRAAAVAAGAFIPENNVITGLSVHAASGTVFACVPRWRRGVPSTLNTVVKNATGHDVLRPWPSWFTNQQVFSYVQSVWLDEAHDHLYVIDTGRQNFLGGEPQYVVDAPAKLHVFALSSAHSTVQTKKGQHTKGGSRSSDTHNDVSVQNPREIYYHVFGPAMFSYNTSFLNDVVVDTRRGVAFMTDTNMNPLGGGLVAHSLRTGASVRFEGPSTNADLSYVCEMNGVKYPTFQSPSDGIALSSDGSTLFYSAVDGDVLYSLDALLFGSLVSSSDDHDTDRHEHVIRGSDNAVGKTVKKVTKKPSFGDGLRFVSFNAASAEAHAATHGVFYGGFSQNALFYSELRFDTNTSYHFVATHRVAQSDVSLQWLDSFAVVYNSAATRGPTERKERETSGEAQLCPSLYFTTNKLQKWLTKTMDFTGKDGANMRILRFDTCST